MSRSVCAVVLLMMMGSALAEGELKVSVGAEADDELGKALVLSYRLALDRQIDLHLAADQATSDLDVSIITLDPDPAGKRGETIYSAMWSSLVSGEQSTRMLLSHVVGVCDETLMDRCVTRLMTRTREAVT